MNETLLPRASSTQSVGGSLVCRVGCGDIGQRTMKSGHSVAIRNIPIMPKFTLWKIGRKAATTTAIGCWWTGLCSCVSTSARSTRSMILDLRFVVGNKLPLLLILNLQRLATIGFHLERSYHLQQIIGVQNGRLQGFRGHVGSMLADGWQDLGCNPALEFLCAGKFA